MYFYQLYYQYSLNIVTFQAQFYGKLLEQPSVALLSCPTVFFITYFTVYTVGKYMMMKNDNKMSSDMRSVPDLKNNGKCTLDENII